MSFRLQIITPETTVFDGEVDSVTVPGITGSIGILTNHAPMIAVLNVGIVKYQHAGSQTFCVIGDGTLEVGTGATVIMAGVVITASDLVDADKKFAMLAKERHALFLAR